MGDTHKWDIFISHASEDKNEVARPLKKNLEAAGLKVWFDESTLQIGDSLREKIDEGLRESRFGVVILSPQYIAKDWPNRELDGLLGLEEGGSKRILPVWHNVNKSDVMKYSPILANKYAANTSKGLAVVVDEILQVFPELELEIIPDTVDPSLQKKNKFKIRKEVTDKDKLDFLRAAYRQIASSFESNLKEMAGSDPDIETDYDRITTEKFTCTVFVSGNKKATCQIWISRDWRDESIKYSSSLNDSSYNESISVEHDGYQLYLHPQMNMWGRGKDNMSQEEIVEYLWEKFMEQLQ